MLSIGLAVFGMTRRRKKA
ncbi:MAG: hypothetical protein ACXWC3_10110 [Burkholderiales bacterium]